MLEYQQNVLLMAAHFRMPVFDIVIDKEFAEGRAVRTIFTVPELTHNYAGSLVRHVAKPDHPSFTGTDLAERLEADHVNSLVVMGFDANQCVKATIFGGPEAVIRKVRGGRAPSRTNTAALTRTPVKTRCAWTAHWLDPTLHARPSRPRVPRTDFPRNPCLPRRPTPRCRVRCTARPVSREVPRISIVGTPI